MFRSRSVQDSDEHFHHDSIWGNATSRRLHQVPTALTHSRRGTLLTASKRNYDLLLANTKAICTFPTVMAIRGRPFTTTAIGLAKLRLWGTDGCVNCFDISSIGTYPFTELRTHRKDSTSPSLPARKKTESSSEQIVLPWMTRSLIPHGLESRLCRRINPVSPIVPSGSQACAG